MLVKYMESCEKINGRDRNDKQYNKINKISGGYRRSLHKKRPKLSLNKIRSKSDNEIQSSETPEPVTFSAGKSA
jgi:hypothetical protein